MYASRLPLFLLAFDTDVSEMQYKLQREFADATRRNG